MCSLRSMLLLSAVSMLLATSEVEAQQTQPIPFSVTSQTLCHHNPFSLSGPPAGCTSGGSPVVHTFSDSFTVNGFEYLTINGSFRAEVTDGKLVYTISGTANNTGGNSVVWLTGEQVVSFAAPVVVVNGAPLPTTIVAVSLTEDSSALSGASFRSMQAAMPRIASTVLGSNLQSAGAASLTVSRPITNPLYQASRKVMLEMFPSADQLQATVTPTYTVNVPELASNVTFNETFTYELRYLPESSAPLMFSSGAGFLALLVSVLGPRTAI